MNNDRFVKWKCPECGNYHKWVWDIYDIFGGEIAMTCDNPECGRTSKMCMVPEKNGNATALVADNSQVEEPKTPAEIAYKRVYGFYPETYEDSWSAFQDGYIASQKDYKVGEYQPTPQEPEVLKTLYDALQLPYFTNGYHFNEGQKDWICDIVKEWLSQFHPDDMSFENLSYTNAFFDALDLLRKTLR